MSSPSEYNEILWQLAESQDQHQIDEFLAKHPELKDELKARSSMITGIKGSKSAKPKLKTERFMPSAKPLSSGTPRWAAALAASVLMVGAVFATLGTLKFIESKNRPPQPVYPNQIKQPLEANNSTTVPTQTNQDPIPNTFVPDESSGNVPPLNSKKPIENKVTIVARQILLSTALNDIGIQAGIQLNSAPGMPDPEISVDFRDVPAIEVLRALGAKLGFTPMEETGNSILLIPARDPNAPTSNSLPGFVNPSENNQEQGTGLLPLGTPENGRNNNTRATFPNEQE